MEWSSHPKWHLKYQSVVIAKSHKLSEATEIKFSTIGVDLTKNVFQMHGVDDHHHLSLFGKNWGLRLNVRSGERPRLNGGNGAIFQAAGDGRYA
jgi:hypothetical protein